MTSRIFLFVFAIIAFGVFSCKTKSKETEEPKIVANDMPTLPVTLIDSTKLIARDLPGNTILILFLSDCDHCQREVAAISNKLDAFKNYTLYFLSTESSATLKKFAEENKLAEKPNVKFGKVEVSMIIRNFGPIPTPSMYIYSSEKKLIKEFKGESNIDEIIKAL
jgi:hypothetical protein